MLVDVMKPFNKKRFHVKRFTCFQIPYLIPQAFVEGTPVLQERRKSVSSDLDFGGVSGRFKWGAIDTRMESTGE
jgi:hypothetical protein